MTCSGSTSQNLEILSVVTFSSGSAQRQAICERSATSRSSPEQYTNQIRAQARALNVPNGRLRGLGLLLAVHDCKKYIISRAQNHGLHA